MQLRETGTYSLSAHGNGCFLSGGLPVRMIHDKNGERPERVFDTGIILDYDDAGNVEIGEVAIAELAAVLGWIDPDTHSRRYADMSEALQAERKAEFDMIELTDRNTALMKQIIQLNDKLEQAQSSIAAMDEYDAEPSRYSSGDRD